MKYQNLKTLASLKHLSKAANLVGLNKEMEPDAKQISIDFGNDVEKISIEIVNIEEPILLMLQEAIKKEYLQRDMYQAYDYLLFGWDTIAMQEHLQEHMSDEMEHIRILQRYIVSMGGFPTLERHPIPLFWGQPVETILVKDLELEKDAVDSYSSLVVFLDELGGSDFVALRTDIENILTQEKEHFHDIERWLKQSKGAF